MEKDNMSDTIWNLQERPKRCSVDIKSEVREVCTEPREDTQYTPLKNISIIGSSFDHGAI